MNVAKKIILGTAQFGLDYGINNEKGKPNEKDVLDILDLAAQNRIQILDTANAYGNAQEIIGKFHRKNNLRFLINTKFQANVGTSITEQAAKAIDLLKVDSICTYFFHRFDDVFSFPELESELTKLKEKKIILKTGISIYDNQQFESAINSDFIDVIQIPFNLLDNFYQRGDLLNLAKKKNKEIHARSVFLQGLFFKSFNAFPDYLLPLKKYISELYKMSSEASLNMPQLAMGYSLSQNQIDYLIVGVDTKNHLLENIKYASSTLSEKVKNKIDKIKVTEVDLLYPYNWK